MITVLCNAPEGVVVEYGNGHRDMVSEADIEQYERQGQILVDLR